MASTYLFITHDLSLAWVIADRIAVMYLGRVMEIGTAEDVIKNSHHPYTRALVGVSPSPTPVDAATRASRVILRGETPNAAAIPSGCRFHPRCPLAFDRCRTEEPPLFDVGSGQKAACWLAEGGRELPMFQPTVAAGHAATSAAESDRGRLGVAGRPESGRGGAGTGRDRAPLDRERIVGLLEVQARVWPQTGNARRFSDRTGRIGPWTAQRS